MMTVPMDSSLTPLSRELAERLYKKNIELESGLRKLAKSRVPFDPNTWYQIRENYEAIILEDHEFSEKHEVELALWQLHYRRIEEFRAIINAAKSAGAVTTQRGRTPAKPDSIKKIRSGFKIFLSESTGFYHDLILKIRSKFGLPLDFFSDGPERQNMTKDEKKSIVMENGLMSCHRSLIYLGDLARYKGSYGEGDSSIREYAAASSYYKQAASLCPSNGNPHHQLAILASYSGDDLLSIYRYFRSLAADTPFSTARDNLIIAFEKNRQSFSLIPSNLKAVPAKPIVRTAGRGRGRGRGDARLLAKDAKPEAVPMKERKLSIPELLKAFSTRFVRLNGILFTRTSLETFGEIFSSLKSDLLDLLSTGPEEELNFGEYAAENGHFIVRIIAILIFTVHNVNRESEGQSYAEILQRTVLLQNAYTAAFEFAGHIIKRCIQLHNAASSFLLPAMSVFIEWLACHPDIAAGPDNGENQGSSRSFFWNQYVTFMNKLISSGLVSGDGDDDATCFFDMSWYDEGETGNRLALWEDFELRGFLPLVPAQLILDFSRKHSFGDEGEKERRARMQRILAALRALMNVVRVDHQVIYFDSHLKKFVIGVEPPAYDDYMPTGLLEEPKLDVSKEPTPVKSNFNGEDEEEEIVFKPTVMEKYTNPSPVSIAYETNQPAQIMSKGEWGNYSTSISAPFGNFQMPTVLHASSPLQNTTANFNTSKWIMEQAGVLSSGLRNVDMNGNVLLTKNGFQEGLTSLQSTAYSPLVFSGQSKGSEALIPSNFDSTMSSGMTSDGLAMKFLSAFPSSSRKNPVGRPVRHLGPPPGFNNISKQVENSSLELLSNGQNLQIDDYSWLDGYQSSSTKALAMENSVKPSSDNTKLNGVVSFPFPGKQISTVQTPIVDGNKWQDFQLFDNLKPNSEQQFHQQTSFQHSVMPEQHQAQSLWSGRYFV